jgi:hypothetical protein
MIPRPSGGDPQVAQSFSCADTTVAATYHRQITDIFGYVRMGFGGRRNVTDSGLTCVRKQLLDGL